MEEALIAYLLADSGVAAIADDRVFPGRRPQGAGLPNVILQRISGAPEYADDGEAGLAGPRFQIDCWAETYTDAKLLARAVTARISAFAGTMGAIEVQHIELEDERDFPLDAGDPVARPFRTGLDFLVWHTL